MDLLQRPRKLEWPPSHYGKLVLLMLGEYVGAGKVTREAADELTTRWFDKGEA